MDQLGRDPPASLFDRTQLVELLNQAYVRCGLGCGLVALFVDVDRSKMVNDSLGPSVQQLRGRALAAGERSGPAAAAQQLAFLGLWAAAPPTWRSCPLT
jgi:hypothetical protein